LLIRQFIIKIPKTDKAIKVPQGHKLSLVDMPGNDDAKWFVRINNYLKDSEGAAIIPLILINATQGTFDLSHN
jgi:hypothetical protein